MFSVSIPKLDYLAGFFNLFEVGGIIDITGTIAGSLKKPAIAGKLAGSEIHYQNFPIDSIYGNISYENGIINFEDAGFTGALSSIDSLAPIFHIPDVRGDFTYQGNIKGSIDNLKGNVTAQFVNPAYRNFQLDSANVKITLDGKQAEINSFRCYHDSLLIELTGEYFIPLLRGNLSIAFYDVLFNNEKDIDQKMSVLESTGYGNISASFDVSDNHNLVFNIQGKKINIHELLTILPEKIEAGGNLDFQLNFSGTLEQPSCELQIDVNSPVYEQFFSDSLKK